MAVLKYKDPSTGEWLPLNTGGSGSVFGTVDENNNIIIHADLPAGTYTLKYEHDDGTATEIGTLTVTGGGSGYTNLADITSSHWLTNQRIDSSGSILDVTTDQRGDDTVVITNFIDITNVTSLHIKGLDVLSALSSGQNYGRFYVYNSAQELLVRSAKPSNYSYVTTADYDSSVWIIDVVGFLGEWGYSDERYVRLGGILTGAAEDVIITADEPIV